MVVDEAHVINLPERTDRLDLFRKQWVGACPLHIVSARRNRIVPMLGCKQSHYDALYGTGNILVLEDDVTFAPNFWHAIEQLNPPPHWEMIQLGGRHLSMPVPYDTGMVRCTQTDMTHAYIVRNPEEWIRDASQHYPGLAIDIVYNRLHLRRYAPVNWIAGQLPGYSDIALTWREHS